MAASNETELPATGTAGRIARVYAEALAAAAAKADKADDVGVELKDLAKTVYGYESVASFMKSPVVNWRTKEPVLLNSLAGKVSDLVCNFVGVLNKNGRLALLPEIQRAYQALQDKAAGRVRVTVKSAVPLGEPQQQALVSKLTATLKQQPVLNLVVDPELLGGLIVQIGDRVLDTSVRTRIQSLRSQLLDRGTSYVLQNQG
jgi:F-type H+-transporting ATPase subunit delta